MRKKVLMIATVPYMIGQFNMNNINILINLGYEVHVACDWSDTSIWTEDKKNCLKKNLDNLNIKYYQIDYSRSVFNLRNHIVAYRQTLKLLQKYKYNFVHCHTPIASAIARLVCKKTNTKCIYTAHGFHFFEGSSLINWMIFYPIEKWLSKYTDILITINNEDYNRAKQKFFMKRLEYLPGIGININNIKNIVVDKDEMRKNLNISKENRVIISVGELSKRKNHEVVIKALKNFENITYIICGQGVLYDYLQNLANKNHVDLRLLGFRPDRIELVKISDAFIFPSFQEGLPVALMEAVACDIVCIASNVRGNTDLIKNQELLFNPHKEKQCISAIEKGLNDDRNNNKNIKLKNYDEKEINKLMFKIYKNIK